VDRVEPAVDAVSTTVGSKGASIRPIVHVQERCVDRRTAYLLAFATGSLYFLGFAGTELHLSGLVVTDTWLWPCSLVALAPMAVALEGQSARRSLEVGAIAGFTMNMMGFYWLLGMLETFSGFPWPICLIFMALLCAYQGGRMGLFGWLHGRARERGWPGTPVFLLAFAASELLYPLLFPWYFAASVHQVPALTQLAELGGPYLVGLLLAVPSLAIAEAVLARRQHRPFRRYLVAAGFVTPLLAALIGYVRLTQIDARALASEPVHVGIVQGHMPLIPTRQDQVDSLRRHVQMTDQLRAKGADFVVWSEAAVMWNIPENDYDGFLQRLFTRRLRIPSIFGAILNRRETAGRFRAYSAALAADAEGHVVGRYDKQYLLAFGEYLPFGETFPILYRWSPNSGRLTPGTSVAPVPLNGHLVTALICYEDILPGFVNKAVNHGRPEMIVNLTNDAWFGDTTEPWIHLALAQMRAVEHRRYLIRSTNSGVSAVIDPVGRVIAHSGTFRPETVDAIAHWMKGPKTGYEIWGDVPWWLAALAIAAMAFYKRPSGGVLGVLRRWRLAS
jgi:apolipoprotein N-acyltransferase